MPNGNRWAPAADFFGSVTSPADASQITAVTNGRSNVYRSVDGGASWSKIGEIDLNNDESVDFSDFSVFAEHWMDNCSGHDLCGGSDLNCSGRVDFEDILKLADRWLR